MSERDDARSGAAQAPVHGRVGPADPHADPPTDPVLRRPEVPAAEYFCGNGSFGMAIGLDESGMLAGSGGSVTETW